MPQRKMRHMYSPAYLESVLASYRRGEIDRDDRDAIDGC